MKIIAVIVSLCLHGIVFFTFHFFLPTPSQTFLSSVHVQLVTAPPGEHPRTSVRKKNRPLTSVTKKENTPSSPATATLSSHPSTDSHLKLLPEARYPESARQRGISGRARVRVQWDTSTQLSIQLEQSSGFSVLDEEALRIFRDADQTQLSAFVQKQPGNTYSQSVRFELH